nr:patatin-like phospholipase family protein [Solimonas marina]
MLIGAAAALAACAPAPRLPPPAPRLSTADPVGFEGEHVRLAYDSEHAFLEHSKLTFAALRRAAGDGPINALSLSGGGAGGAFGAGALVGWTRSGKRPEFQLVTGVSVGALIAPLAFLGPDWDPVLTRALAGDSSEHLLQRHLLDALFGSSLYAGRPLRELVTPFVTDKLIRAIAREYARGRRLYIETTDLDKGEPVIWDMGAIATHGGPAARKLFTNVLVASASIPAVFPPVLIRVTEHGHEYDEMHVDGATTMPLFIGPEVSALVTRDAPRLQNFRAYVLVDGQLGRFPSKTRLRTHKIVARAFDTNLTHEIRMALALAYNFADRYGMRFQLTAIPTGYPFGGPLDFKPAHMHKLFDYAAHCAESGQLWLSLDTMYHQAMTASAPMPGATPGCPVVDSADAPSDPASAHIQHAPDAHPKPQAVEHP